VAANKSVTGIRFAGWN